MRAHRALWPIATQCRTLEVSTSGYYAGLSRVPSTCARRDREIALRLVDLNRLSRAPYGSPRLVEELAAGWCDRIVNLGADDSGNNGSHASNPDASSPNPNASTNFATASTHERNAQ